MKYFVSIVAFLFVGLVSAVYVPSMRDQKVVVFFVENLVSMIDSMGGSEHADAVIAALGLLQSHHDDERENYIIGEALDRVSLYYNVDVLTGVGRVDLEGDGDSIGIVPVSAVVVSSSPSSSSSASAGSSSQMIVTVYRHPTANRDCGSVSPSYVSVARNKQLLQTTIKTLLAGPSDGTFQGLADRDLSANVRSVVLRDGVAYVDFDSRMRQASWSRACDTEAIFSMLNKTILGVKGVYDVLYAFDGKASDFYSFFHRSCPHDMSYDQCDTAFPTNTLQTSSSMFQQRRWRIWSNAYSVFIDATGSYKDLSQQVYRVCGTGHKRCVSVFDFPSTVSDLVLRLQLKSTRCIQTLKGRLDWCQLSERVFVASLDPWKQLVIIRDEGGMTSEDMVNFLSVLGQ